MLPRRKFLSMLPGFRFLVAAIVFSLSLLVFGLGAAALFRAAHEQFASSSSWRTTPEGSYTSFLPPAEPPRPVIAMLRVEPPQASAPAPTSEPHTELPSTDAPAATPAASAEASDIAPAATAPVAPAVTEEATVAAAPPAPAPEPIVVAAVAPTAAATDVGSAEAAAKTVAAVAAPPLQPPAPEVVAADPPKPESTTTSPAAPPAASSPPVATDVVIPRQDVLPVFAEAKVLTAAAVVTSDAANATPLPDPAPSRSELLAQMIALSADRAAPTEHKASIKIASLHLHQSLAKRRQAQERLAKQRLAEAQRAKRQRQMALRARAAREAAAAQQQQQRIADPFAQPQGFGQQAAFGQQQAQRTR